MNQLQIAMTDDDKEIIKANERFYAAFESLDIKQMEKVWLQDAEIQCVIPAGRFYAVGCQ